MRRILFGMVVAGLAVGCADDDHDHGGEGQLDEAARAAAFSKAFTEAEELKGDVTSCNGVVVPDQSGFNKRVALTFDDGPNVSTTTQIMKTLREYEAPATFFINGNRVNGDAERAILEEIVEDPSFILASHTWSHPQMNAISASAAESQMDRNTEVIKAAGGEARWMRFPFGAANCALMNMIDSRGYTSVGWHVDSADWCYKSSGYCRESTFAHVPDSMRGDMKAWVMKQVRQKNGGVVLFHDIHQFTADQLEGILTALKDEGFTFVNIDDVATFPVLNGQTPPFVGDLCDDNDMCAFGEGSFCHRAGFCTLPCEGYCPDQGGKASTFCTADPDVPSVGICVSQAGEMNGNCADLPGTIDASAERFIGGSSAPARSAEVCLPAPVATDE